MTEDYKAKYEALVLDYAKVVTAYGELLARLSPPLPVYPQVPALPYQPYPWIVRSGSSSTWQPPNTTQAYNAAPGEASVGYLGVTSDGSVSASAKNTASLYGLMRDGLARASERCATCDVPLPGDCNVIGGRRGVFCSSACMAAFDSMAQGAR